MSFKSLNFKTFVKGNLTSVKFNGPHQPWFDGPEKDYCRTCNSLGEPTVLNNNGKYKRRNINEVSYDGAVIMHYQYKSTDEFCNKITKRKHIEMIKDERYRTVVVDEYFNHNAITKEKIQIIEKCLGKKIDDKYNRHLKESIKN